MSDASKPSEKAINVWHLAKDAYESTGMEWASRSAIAAISGISNEPLNNAEKAAASIIDAALQAEVAKRREVVEKLLEATDPIDLDVYGVEPPEPVETRGIVGGAIVDQNGMRIDTQKIWDRLMYLSCYHQRCVEARAAALLRGGE